MADVVRIKGQTVHVPILYGNSAYVLEKKNEFNHTHQWSLYVKPHQNSSFDKIVKKVTFRLHESYQEQMRVVENPPYEISETGWGEFEAIIRIYFHEQSEKPITLYHVIRLFSTELVNVVKLPNHTIISEFYDELVFNDPYNTIYEIIKEKSNEEILYDIGPVDWNDKAKNTESRLNEALEQIKNQNLNSTDVLKTYKKRIEFLRQKI